MVTLAENKSSSTVFSERSSKGSAEVNDKGLAEPKSEKNDSDKALKYKPQTKVPRTESPDNLAMKSVRSQFD